MEALKRYFNEAFGDLKAALFDDKDSFVKSERAIEKQFEKHIIIESCKRQLVFSVFFALFILIYTVFDFVSGNILGVIGDILSILSSIILFIAIVLRINNKIKLKNTAALFFIVGIASLLCVYNQCVSDSFSSIFIIISLTAAFVPMFTAQQNISFQISYGGLSMIIGGVCGKSVLIYLITAVVMTALGSYVFHISSQIWASRFQIAEANERSEKICDFDSVTGLLNKQGLEKKLKKCLTDNTSSISVVIVDIDKFKEYNLRCGVKESDKCLFNIGNCIKIISKMKTEMISRFYGDEFLIAIEDVSEVDLITLCEQIRSSIEVMALPYGDEKLTVSVGVSVISKEGSVGLNELIIDAEKSLYIAKSDGGNCIGYRGRTFKKEE